MTDANFVAYGHSIVIGTPDGKSKIVRPCHITGREPHIWKAISETEKTIRPWKVAIKSLLKRHLAPIAETFVRDPHARHIGTEVLGITFSLEGSSIPPDVLVSKILHTPNVFRYNGKHDNDVDAILSAKALYSKMESLRALMNHHPDIARVPMFRGDSITPPREEDRELNDLLKETATLARMHQADYMILLEPDSVEWPDSKENCVFLFDFEDFLESIEQVFEEVK